MAVIEHSKSRKMTAHFITEIVVDRPAPVRRQNLVTYFRIVSNGDMNGPGTTGRRYGSRIAIGPLVFKGRIDDITAVIGQSDRRRIGNKITHRQ